ncbi:MAG: 2-polyprenyl-6-hydroxyphenyl methylase/3-demethylubiquinone-9 3-methyltransferase [Planctomycetota bacterium]|jgi:2-polyprenyl-6-hydroxyphenyl methylase/3-demethylubiquinone-9 3-methyltransferase
MPDSTENIDADELLKFERLSDAWWDPSGDLKTLHVINPIRLSYIDDAVSLSNKRVLDVGCGGGLLTEAMETRGGRVSGLDANESAINVARAHANLSQSHVDYVIATAEQYAIEAKHTFDVITCMELVEHVPDPGSLMSACAEMLKPGGDLIIATLNRNARSYASAILAAEYILGLLPKGTHDYAKFIKPSEIARELRKLNFDVIDISGMHYLPLANRCILNNDPAVNYLLHARART